MTLAATLAAGMAVVLTLAPAKPVRRDVPGFPRIAAPADDAQRRINRALDRLDSRVRTAARECLADSHVRRGDWARQIDVTMRGPDFLSFLVTDDVDCGGAHPDEGHSAIVYDLRTGTPVDWRALLPPVLTGTLALTDGADGVKVVTLASPRLFALYRARYDHGAAGDEEQECRQAIAQGGAATPMLAWLDAQTGGLALQFDLGHAEQACSEPVVLPIALLRHEGASPRLLAALTAASMRARARR